MTVKELAEKAGFKILSGDGEKTVESIYCGDLLSIVMANAPENSLWATIMIHRSVIAVAQLRDVACVLICGNMQPESDTLEAANENDITILSSDKPIYESVLHATKILGLI